MEKKFTTPKKQTKLPFAILDKKGTSSKSLPSETLKRKLAEDGFKGSKSAKQIAKQIPSDLPKPIDGVRKGSNSAEVVAGGSGSRSKINQSTVSPTHEVTSSSEWDEQQRTNAQKVQKKLVNGPLDSFCKPIPKKSVMDTGEISSTIDIEPASGTSSPVSDMSKSVTDLFVKSEGMEISLAAPAELLEVESDCEVVQVLSSDTDDCDSEPESASSKSVTQSSGQDGKAAASYAGSRNDAKGSGTDSWGSASNVQKSSNESLNMSGLLCLSDEGDDNADGPSVHSSEVSLNEGPQKSSEDAKHVGDVNKDSGGDTKQVTGTEVEKAPADAVGDSTPQPKKSSRISANKQPSAEKKAARLQAQESAKEKKAQLLKEKEMKAKARLEQKTKRDEEKKALIEAKKLKAAEREKERQLAQEKKEAEQQKRKEESEAKKEEKRKKEEEKLEEKAKKEMEKKKIEEDKRRKEESQKKIMMNFFKKKSKPATPEPTGALVDQYIRFKPFEVPANTFVAPTTRVKNFDGSSLDKFLENQNIEANYLVDLKTCVRKPLSSPPTIPLDLYDVEVISDTAGDNISSTSTSSKKPPHRFKLLSFHQDHRPPYFGTWRKQSRQVGPRRPLAKDLSHLDYDVDSEEEWEEEEPGESLSDSEGEEEDVVEEDMDPECQEDGFLVEHGYLSEDEGGEDQSELTSAERKERLMWKKKEYDSMQQAKGAKKVPLVVGPCWSPQEQSGAAPAAAPAQNTSIGADQLNKLEMIVFASLPLETLESNPALQQAPEVGRAQPSPNHSSNKTPSDKKIRPVPEEAMPYLIQLVHGNKLSIQRIIIEFLAFWKSRCEKDVPQDKPSEFPPSISKRQLDLKIKSVATYEKRGQQRPYWYVYDSFIEQYKAQVSVPTTWTFVTVSKSKPLTENKVNSPTKAGLEAPAAKKPRKISFTTISKPEAKTAAISQMFNRMSSVNSQAKGSSQSASSGAQQCPPESKPNTVSGNTAQAMETNENVVKPTVKSGGLESPQTQLPQPLSAPPQSRRITPTLYADASSREGYFSDSSSHAITVGQSPITPSTFKGCVPSRRITPIKVKSTVSPASCFSPQATAGSTPTTRDSTVQHTPGTTPTGAIPTTGTTPTTGATPTTGNTNRDPNVEHTPTGPPQAGSLPVSTPRSGSSSEKKPRRIQPVQILD